MSVYRRQSAECQGRRRTGDSEHSFHRTSRFAKSINPVRCSAGISRERVARVLYQGITFPTMSQYILLIGCFDTKGEVFAYLRKAILAKGERVLTIDTGVMG